MSEDVHLTRISTLHFILGVLNFAAFPLIFLLSLYISPDELWGGTVTLAGFLFLFVLSVALMASSRAVETRKWRVFSLICGALALLLFPVGTIIGIYTLVVLMRREVGAIYAQGGRYWHG